MTIYQEEMQRKALRYGCITNYDEENQLLNISHKGVDLASITGNGFMHYKNQDLTDPETRDVFVRLLDEVDTVREYVPVNVIDVDASKLGKTHAAVKEEGNDTEITLT